MGAPGKALETTEIAKRMNDSMNLQEIMKALDLKCRHFDVTNKLRHRSRE
jgi:hypothetical protein